MTVSSIHESRLGVRCRVANLSPQEEGMVLFSRAWYPGYRAFLDGKPLDVLVVNGLQPAVKVPPGAAGELTLRFAPRSLHYGLVIGVCGIVIAAIGPWWLSRMNHNIRHGCQSCAAEQSCRSS